MYELTTLLHVNPFHILRVSTRDNRQTILEAADEKGLYLDPEICNKARSDLLNPRARICAEVGWMPGVPPENAVNFVDALSSKSLNIRIGNKLPYLARANWMAAILELLKASMPSEIIGEAIHQFSLLVDKIVASDVWKDINEDRIISKFPEIKSLSVIEEELSGLKKKYRVILKKLLGKIESNKLIEVLTISISAATNKGMRPGPEILDELVDIYEVEIQTILQKEYDNIKLLLQKVRDAAPSGEANVAQAFDRLEKVARNWERLALPIQISAKSRGLEHNQSIDVAYDLRKLGVDLNNDFGMIDQAYRMTRLLHDIFSQLPSFSETLTEDTQALAEIKDKAAERKKREADWERSIFFKADVGLVFKDELAISSSGIRWKNKTYSLESITRVRWGAVQNSINGIPTGTDYIIAFGDNYSEQSISLRNKNIYYGFLDALWKSVCVRLIIDTLAKLSEGRAFSFGNMTIENETVVLIRHKLLGMKEKVRYKWKNICIENGNGTFVIRALNENNVYSEASYIKDYNTHIYENIIQGSLRKNIYRLSEYLKE